MGPELVFLPLTILNLSTSLITSTGLGGLSVYNPKLNSSWVSDPDHHSLLAPKVAPLVQPQSLFGKRVPEVPTWITQD